MDLRHCCQKLAVGEHKVCPTQPGNVDFHHQGETPKCPVSVLFSYTLIVRFQAPDSTKISWVALRSKRHRHSRCYR